MRLPPAKAWLSPLQSLTSVVALYVAWLAFSIDTNEPKLEGAAPKVLRVEFAKNYTNIYAQPSFLVMNPTRKVAVIKDLCLRLAPATEARRQHASFADACRPSPGDGSLLLRWHHLAKFDWDTAKDVSFYEEMVSDALPMPVSIGNPQAPLAAFGGSAALQARLEADRCYRASLHSLSAPGERMLTIEFGFRLSQQQLQSLRNLSTQPPYQPHHITLEALPAESC